MNTTKDIVPQDIKMPPQLRDELSELNHAIFQQVSEICGGPQYPNFFSLPSTVREILTGTSVADVASREAILKDHAGKTAGHATRKARSLNSILNVLGAIRGIGSSTGPSGVGPKDDPTYEACEFKAWLDYLICCEEFGHTWPEYEQLSPKFRDELLGLATTQILQHNDFLTERLGK